MLIPSFVQEESSFEGIKAINRTDIKTVEMLEAGAKFTKYRQRRGMQYTRPAVPGAGVPALPRRRTGQRW